MRSILLKVSPEEAVNLLNGDLSILIRKVRINPNCELPIDVYIYVAADTSKGFLYKVRGFGYRLEDEIDVFLPPKNGKVVAKFTLTKVEHLYEYQVDGYGSDYEVASETLKQDELLEKCHLTYDQLSDYFYLGDINNGYAWFIENPVIFDKPKELGDFRYYWCGSAWHKEGCHGMYCDFCDKYARQLTNAPKNFCYVKGINIYE